MKCGIALFFVCFLLLSSVSRAVETSLRNFPEWGESIERVIRERHINLYVMEESKSLLFNVPVQTMLVRETVEKQQCTVLYSFLDNKLIEYILRFEEDSTDTYNTIRTHLELLYETYTGTLFFNAGDVFADKARKTGVFLLKNKNGDTILYFLDMTVYASMKKF